MRRVTDCTRMCISRWSPCDMCISRWGPCDMCISCVMSEQVAALPGESRENVVRLRAQTDASLRMTDDQVNDLSPEQRQIVLRLRRQLRGVVRRS